MQKAKGGPNKKSGIQKLTSGGTIIYLEPDRFLINMFLINM